jgi:rhodanese-related sulfurtransferase
MGLLDSIKKRLGGATQPVNSTYSHRDATREEAAVIVPEVTAGELLAGHGDGVQPVLLDIREPFERAQSLIPGSLHIPMNSLPSRLGELDPSHDIVVYCAHGNRSYGVTGWLMQQGYKARSLKGGIADWQRQRGPVQRR